MFGVGAACAGAEQLLGGGGDKKEAAAKEEAASPATPWHSIAGEYQTSYGKMTIVEEGQSWTGTYPGGTLRCTFVGKRYNEYDCQYADSAGSGPATVWYEGSGLRGKWYDSKNELQWWEFGPGDGPALDGSAPVADTGGGGGGERAECEHDNGCGPGFKMLCDQGKCIEAYGNCDFDRDCRGGAKCMQGSRCANSAYGWCEFDRDCGGGLKCSRGKCQ